MKVLVFGLRGFPLVEGGVERHCESLYPRLGPGVEVAICRRRPYVVPATGQAGTGIRFVDLPSTRIKGFEAVFHSFLATLRAIREKPDVVHIHNIGPALFAPWLRRCGIPVVLTYHSPNYEHEKWGWFGRKVLLFSEKKALAAANRVIFVNRYQMQKYPLAIREKSVYIPNGIEPPAAPAGQDELAKLGVEPGRYVLSVGRITPEKGFDTLIRGFRTAAPAGFKLVIAGGVETEDGYMAELHKLGGGDVVFAGKVFGEKLAQLYAYAGLFVLASNNEGFPIVLLEAMSHALDVLVSDIPGTRLVDLDEDDYFPRGDAETLAAKLRERLSTPLRRRAYNLAQYDWKRIADATIAVYRAALAR